MTALAFDTHAFVKRLHEVGFTDAQAERLTELYQGSAKAIREQLSRHESASKRNIKELELKIADIKEDLIRWIVGAGLLQTALIAALMLKLSSGI